MAGRGTPGRLTPPMLRASVSGAGSPGFSAALRPAKAAAMAGLYREMYQGIIDGRVVMEGGAARAVAGSVAVDATLRRLLAPAS